MGCTQLSGSEVMGLVGSLLSARTKCRLSGNKLPDRLRHSFSRIWTQFTMSATKSQMFPRQRIVLF